MFAFSNGTDHGEGLKFRGRFKSALDAAAAGFAAYPQQSTVVVAEIAEGQPLRSLGLGRAVLDAIYAALVPEHGRGMVDGWLAGMESAVPALEAEIVGVVENWLEGEGREKTLRAYVGLGPWVRNGKTFWPQPAAVVTQPGVYGTHSGKGLVVRGRDKDGWYIVPEIPLRWRDSGGLVVPPSVPDEAKYADCNLTGFVAPLSALCRVDHDSAALLPASEVASLRIAPSAAMEGLFPASSGSAEIPSETGRWLLRNRRVVWLDASRDGRRKGWTRDLPGIEERYEWLPSGECANGKPGWALAERISDFPLTGPGIYRDQFGRGWHIVGRDAAGWYAETPAGEPRTIRATRRWSDSGVEITDSTQTIILVERVGDLDRWNECDECMVSPQQLSSGMKLGPPTGSVMTTPGIYVAASGGAWRVDEAGDRCWGTSSRNMIWNHEGRCLFSGVQRSPLHRWDLIERLCDTSMWPANVTDCAPIPMHVVGEIRRVLRDRAI